MHLDLLSNLGKAGFQVPAERDSAVSRGGLRAGWCAPFLARCRWLSGNWRKSCCHGSSSVSVFDRARYAAPLVLRIGLGILWIVSGPISSRLGHSAAALDHVSHPAFARLASPDSLFWLRTAEVTLGVSLILGVWVSGLAVLQVTFVAVSGVAALRPGSGTDIGLGFLGRASALLAGALVLVATGGGAHTLAAWLTRSRTFRRLRFRWALQTSRLMLAGVEEICRVHVQAAADPRVCTALDRLRLDAGEHAQDIACLILRHGGRPLPVLGPVLGLAWVLGCLTAMAGTGAALRVDRWLIRRGAARYAWMDGLVAPDDGITARALAAMRSREARHAQLLRDAWEESRTTRTHRG